MPVYFIRHGQSEFNAAFTGGGIDPMIFDAPLTDMGLRQAEAAKKLVANNTINTMGLRLRPSVYLPKNGCKIEPTINIAAKIKPA